jgi:hypothetical protein
MRYELTQHARAVLAAREIRIEWMERVLSHPILILPDRADPHLEHRLGRIREHGNRVLRVIVNKTTLPQRVISVYFDRTMMGKL